MISCSCKTTVYATLLLRVTSYTSQRLNSRVLDEAISKDKRKTPCGKLISCSLFSTVRILENLQKNSWKASPHTKEIRAFFNGQKASPLFSSQSGKFNEATCGRRLTKATQRLNSLAPNLPNILWLTGIFFLFSLLPPTPFRRIPKSRQWWSRLFSSGNVFLNLSSNSSRMPVANSFRSFHQSFGSLATQVNPPSTIHTDKVLHFFIRSVLLAVFWSLTRFFLLQIPTKNKRTFAVSHFFDFFCVHVQQGTWFLRWNALANLLLKQCNLFPHFINESRKFPPQTPLLLGPKH